MRAKIHSVSFSLATAALASETWPLNESGEREIGGCVSLRISGKIQRSSDTWPSDDLRKGEQDIAELVMHRLNSFEALEKERDALIAQLEQVREKVGK